RGDARERERGAAGIARVGAAVRTAVGARVARVGAVAGADRETPVARVEIALFGEASGAGAGSEQCGEGCCGHMGYLGGSRSAERKARITSSRLFSLISSSAKRVGRSSCGASTGVSLKKVGAPGLAAAGAGRGGTGVVGATGVMRGGALGRVGCPGARVTAG